MSCLKATFAAITGSTTIPDALAITQIAEAYPAGQYLIGKGVARAAFNSYGSRRGNHEVMMRGTFGNIRIKNRLVATSSVSPRRPCPWAQPVRPGFTECRSE